LFVVGEMNAACDESAEFAPRSNRGLEGGINTGRTGGAARYNGRQP
jgi:hypothetical protein